MIALIRARSSSLPKQPDLNPTSAASMWLQICLFPSDPSRSRRTLARKRHRPDRPATRRHRAGRWKSAIRSRSKIRNRAPNSARLMWIPFSRVGISSDHQAMSGSAWCGLIPPRRIFDVIAGDQLSLRGGQLMAGCGTLSRGSKPDLGSDRKQRPQPAQISKPVSNAEPWRGVPLEPAIERFCVRRF